MGSLFEPKGRHRPVFVDPDANVSEISIGKAAMNLPVKWCAAGQKANPHRFERLGFYGRFLRHFAGCFGSNHLKLVDGFDHDPLLVEEGGVNDHLQSAVGTLVIPKQIVTHLLCLHRFAEFLFESSFAQKC